MRRLTRYVGGSALTLEYDYDSMGRVTSVTYPDGRVVTQGYDTTGRLTAMPGYLSGSIAYDAVGRPASWTMANGVAASQGYDKVGRIASLGYSGDDDIASFSFRYDGAGNMVGKNRSSYSYDSRNRLSLADEIGRYAADAREMGKAAAYASLDATGSRAMSHVSLDAEIRLDQGAASVGIDLGASYEVATITATPLSSTHRVEERNVAVYVSTYGTDYAEVDDWSFATLEDGSLYIRLAEPVKARYVKLHCRYDRDRRLSRRSPVVVEPDSLRSQVNGGAALSCVALTDTVPMQGTTRRPNRDCSYKGIACTRRRVSKRRRPSRCEGSASWTGPAEMIYEACTISRAARAACRAYHTTITAT